MDFVFIDECEHLPEWVWRQYGLQGPMSTEQSTKRRADVLPSTCSVPGPRSVSPLCEVPVKGVNKITFNNSAVRDVFAHYLNGKLFADIEPAVQVNEVKDIGDGMVVSFQERQEVDDAE